ncbi:HAMP domain-containing protein [Rhodobacterales bacterium HKCCE2091]|nr:HAMP domain-containing protein [Rhodobacterales bacterium HKCCE2091]
MVFGWIKRAVPRGLYGRAALILVVPVVGLQLVVSVVFLQRHFEGVTEQMTRSIALDLQLLRERLEAGGIAAAEDVAGPLELTLAPGTVPDWTARRSDRRLFYDFSGRVVIRTLRDMVPDVTWVDLYGDTRTVSLNLTYGTGESADVSFSRRRVSASNPHQLLVLMVFSGLLMTAVAYVFLRNQLRPIRRLARAAEAFGKGRVVDYHPSGALEVRSAGRAFLDMRARIEQQIEQRTLMLSGVSHDLRTPLTRMKLALSMADETTETAELTRDVEDMQGLIDTFLDFARGDAQEDPEHCDPAEIAARVVEDAARGGGAVELAAPADCPEVSLRPQAVRRALANLVSNALRYGTRARVGLRVTERQVRFSVEDDGPGIPEDQRDRALTPFARLDASRNQDKGSGVGLGLAIANDIARSHGGRLRLTDSADLGGLKAELILAR